MTVDAVESPQDAAVTELPKRKVGRPKGLGKVPGSGRKRGTPNRRTAQVHELLLALKCDPITGMARIAMNAKNPPDLRGRMYSELAQYLFPKRKALEVSTTPAEGFAALLEELDRRQNAKPAAPDPTGSDDVDASPCSDTGAENSQDQGKHQGGIQEDRGECRQ